jgi:uncharacterized protein YvpB
MFGTALRLDDQGAMELNRRVSKMDPQNTTPRRPTFRWLSSTRARRVGLAVLLVGVAIGATGIIGTGLLSSAGNGTAVADSGSPSASLSPGATTATATPTTVPTDSPTIVPTVVPTARPTATPAPPQTVFTIPVPVIRQTMALDCETAALQMGLATYGYYYSQEALFALENPDLRAPVMGPNHTVLRWGDPYRQFVGNVNGSDWIPTGYGVYYPVITTIAQSKGLTNARGGEGYAPATAYQALSTGHAVEVWIETNWIRTFVGTWTAWDGRAVRYSYAEHTVVLSGVSPTQVRVNDPLHGIQYWVSKALFETNWADFNNMAVIF